MTDWDINTTFTERMKDERPLTFADFVGMLDWLKKTYNVSAIGVLELRAAVQLDQTSKETRRATEKFNNSSDKLSGRIYWLTWGVFILTAVLVILAVIKR